jgi:hypothetical protein
MVLKLTMCDDLMSSLVISSDIDVGAHDHDAGLLHKQLQTIEKKAEQMFVRVLN